MKQFDIYSELKKEDRKFGEKSSKASPKDHKKRIKHADNFSKMRPSDIIAMGDDDYELEDEYSMA
jgi:hypothetical protein